MRKTAASVGEALRHGAKSLTHSETPQLDARILLKFVLDTDNAGLIARANEKLDDVQGARFEALLARRIGGEPVAYITGVKEFWSLPFRVTPDVLIPRDDSGALIEAALARRGRDEVLRIADLGTGSGCLLCALLSEFPNAEGIGVDRSQAALSVARTNAESLGLAGQARFAAGDWLAPLSGEIDLIVANPPYIPDGDRAGLSRDVADFEPSGALFAGPDGFAAYREILKTLPARLSNDALVIMECGSGQAEMLAAMLGAIAGDSEIFTLSDLAGRPRGAGVDRRRTLNAGQKKD